MSKYQAGDKVRVIIDGELVEYGSYLNIKVGGREFAFSKYDDHDELMGLVAEATSIEVVRMAEPQELGVVVDTTHQIPFGKEHRGPIARAPQEHSIRPWVCFECGRLNWDNVTQVHHEDLEEDEA